MNLESIRCRRNKSDCNGFITPFDADVVGCEPRKLTSLNLALPVLLVQAMIRE